ncbi:MAG: hypothetical protein ACR2NR_09305 [Solirubrobacteraceae bacterium]
MSSEHDSETPDDPLVGPRGDEPTSPAAYDHEPGAELAPAPESESSSPAVSEPREELSAPTPRMADADAPPHARSANMLPQRERRSSGVERLMVRLIATAGIVGIGVAIAAIMVSSKSQGWVVGLVVSIVSVILAAVLWSSRML